MPLKHITMTPSTADKLFSLYEHLIGTEHEGKFISAIIKVPADQSGIAEAAYNLMNGLPCFDNLRNLVELDVVVLFDLDDWHQSGVLDWEPLVLFLDRHAELKK